MNNPTATQAATTNIVNVEDNLEQIDKGEFASPARKVITDTDVLHKLFIMNYIVSHKPKSDIFVAQDLEGAKQLAFNYCKRFNLRYLSVQPFVIDIMKDCNEDRFKHPKDGYMQRE